MSEYLSLVNEAVEGFPGERLALRDQELQKSYEASSHGPLDLCIITKVFDFVFIPELLRAEPTSNTYFHNVVGLDMSSNEAGLAAYIYHLINSQDPPSWLSTGVWKIEKCMFCIYDVFTNLDIRVEVHIPGSITAYAYNYVDNETSTIESSLWDTLYVSSVARSLAFLSNRQPETISKNNIKIMDPLPSQEAEDHFSRVLKQNIFKSSVFGSEDPVIPPDNFNNRLVGVVNRYFSEMNRYSKIIEIFAEFVHADASLVIPVANAHAEMYQIDYALNILCNSVTRLPEYVPLLVAQAETLIRAGHTELARKIARSVVDLEPLYSKGWIVLAKCFVVAKQYEMALLATNMSLYEKSSEVIAQKQQHSFSSSDNFVFPARKIENSAYQILVDIANELGWQGLLDIRSEVFVMEAEDSFSQESYLDETPYSNRIEASVLSPQDINTMNTVLNSSLQEVQDDLKAEENLKELNDKEYDEKSLDGEPIVNEDPERGSQSDEGSASSNEEPLKPNRVEKIKELKAGGEDETSTSASGYERDNELSENDDISHHGGKKRRITNSEQVLRRHSMDRKPKECESGYESDDDLGEGATDNLGRAIHVKYGNQKGKGGEKHQNVHSTPFVVPIRIPTSVTPNIGSPRHIHSALTLPDYDGKRLCGDVLDSVFLSLFHDLRAFASWVEKKDSSMQPQQLLRIAKIAERLKSFAESAYAYEQCIRMLKSKWKQPEQGKRGDFPALRMLSAAYLGHLKVSLHQGDLEACIGNIQDQVEIRSPLTTDEIDISLRNSMWSIVSGFGLKKVKEYMEEKGNSEPKLHGLLEDCVHWKVNGFDG